MYNANAKYVVGVAFFCYFCIKEITEQIVHQMGVKYCIFLLELDWFTQITKSRINTKPSTILSWKFSTVFYHQTNQRKNINDIISSSQFYRALKKM